MGIKTGRYQFRLQEVKIKLKLQTFIAMIYSNTLHCLLPNVQRS